MLDEEKAEEYACKLLSDSKYPFIFNKQKVKAYIIKVYLDSLKCCKNAYNKGLAEGKPKWHDLRKNPEDLPKESDKYLCAWEGGEQWIMDFETEVNSFGYWCNVYDEQSLGFVDSVFETIKERGEDEVIAWCELPEFEEK